MASVTQTIPSFLGGVSKQPDVRKKEGQLTDIINGLPDPTAGLMKRPGLAYVTKIGDFPDYTGAKWFHAFRDKSESYFGVIHNDTLQVWDALTGEKATVVAGDVEGTVTSIAEVTSPYLNAERKEDYDCLTVQDITYITNKDFVVKQVEPETFYPNTIGTVRLMSVEYSATYTITINGTAFTELTRNGDNVEDQDQHTNVLNADQILDALLSKINSGGTGVTATRLRNSIELSANDNVTPFTLEATGGITNESLQAYQNSVQNVAQLAEEAYQGRLVKIVNTATEKDTYYTEYQADDEVSGTGYWEEARGYDASPGLDVSTMPHQLLSLGIGRFVWNADENKYDFENDANPSNKPCFMFKPGNYTERLVGDKFSNSNPSFVDKTIQQAFFFSNRLGFLTSDNVSMSQSGEYMNFFHISALAQTDADPVDISCSSIRPALLSGVVPVAQGLLLFSRTQQFLMRSADAGNLAPTTAIIQTLSNYEYDIDIEPVNSGTRVNFISKTKSTTVAPTLFGGANPSLGTTTPEGYTRLFGMMVQGENTEPLVVDISSVVADWIPNTVDQLVASPQNSFVAMASSTSDEIYFFRTHSDGQKDIMQAWYKWVVPGKVQTMVVQNDVFSLIVEAAGEYSIIRGILNIIKDDEVTVVSDGVIYGAPCVDMFARPEGVTHPGLDTIITLPYNDITDKQPVVVVADPEKPVIEYTPVRSGNTWLIQGVDLTDDAPHMIVGYKYALDVVLPTTYWRDPRDPSNVDFTASLTLSRYKFIVGLSEEITFKLAAQGSNEWWDIDPIVVETPYVSSNLSVDKQTLFHFPIHQRNNHFNVRVYSDSAFPVSLISMAWEGNYSPRFYRRT